MTARGLITSRDAKVRALRAKKGVRGPRTITATLEHPPTLRYAGWSLETLGQARMVEGSYRQLANGDRKILRLYRDGMMVLAVSAGPDFLGWGDPAEYRAHPRIISLALIEVTYLFCVAYAEVIKDLTTKPRSISFDVRLGRLRSADTEQPVNLHPYLADSGSMLLSRDRYPAPDDTYLTVFDIPLEDFRPEVTAYEILKEIYLWFGIETGQMPYTETISGRTAISPEQIRSRGK